MKVAKIKNQKESKKEVMEKDSYSVMSMLKIILVVLITFIAFYVITYFVIKKDDSNNNTNYNTQIDSTKITFNNLLNRSEDEYYVLAYKSKRENDKVDYKTLYDNYINKYNSNEDALKFYMIDINDAFNKSFISDELNISDNLEELKVNDEVLFKINKGSIEDTYVGSKEILNKLSEI